MEISKFIDLFADAIDAEASLISADTEFREMDEWNSLGYLSVIAMLDEEYGVQIENSEFKTLKTIGDIVAYIESHK